MIIGNQQISKVEKGDTRIFWGLFFPTIVLSIQLILTTAKIFPLEVTKPIVFLVSGLSILTAIPSIIRRNRKKFFYAYVFTITIILVTYLIFPNNRIYLKQECKYIFLLCLPSFLGIASIKELNVLKENLLRFSYIMVITVIIYVILILVGRISVLQGDYNMAFSYYLLIPSIILFEQRHRLINFVLFIGVTLSVLFFGSRGALFSIVLYMIISSFILSKKRNTVVITIIGIFFLVFYKEITRMLLELANILGIYSRSIYLLLSNEFITHNSGRDVFYEKILSYLKEYPIFGNGLWGDRVILEGAYSHNLILELTVNFGIFLGPIIIATLIYLMVKVWLKSDIESKKIFLLFICSGLIPLFVSGSYLKSAEFWIFLGSLIMLRKKPNLFNYRSN